MERMEDNGRMVFLGFLGNTLAIFFFFWGGRSERFFQVLNSKRCLTSDDNVLYCGIVQCTHATLDTRNAESDDALSVSHLKM